MRVSLTPDFCDDIEANPSKRPKVFVHVRPAIDPGNNDPLNGGALFGPAVEVANSRVCGLSQGGDEIPAFPFGAVVGPVVAWDQRLDGGGRVYLAYLDEDGDESDDTNIYVVYSDNPLDEPPTWEGPLRVTDDGACSAQNGCSQFNHDMDLDQTTGQVVISWYDSREDPGNVLTKVYAAYSTNLMTPSFTANVAVSTSQSTANAIVQDNEFGRKVYGDYAGVASHAGVFLPAWGHDAQELNNPDGKAEVFTTAVPLPTGP